MRQSETDEGFAIDKVFAQTGIWTTESSSTKPSLHSCSTVTTSDLYVCSHNNKLVKGKEGFYVGFTRVAYIRNIFRPMTMLIVTETWGQRVDSEIHSFPHGAIMMENCMALKWFSHKNFNFKFNWLSLGRTLANEKCYPLYFFTFTMTLTLTLHDFDSDYDYDTFNPSLT